MLSTLYVDFVYMVCEHCQCSTISTFCHQVELDSTIRESILDIKPENYFHRNYLRNQGLITHVGNIADAVSVLTQATEAVIAGRGMSHVTVFILIA